jgi:NADH dehydrogenase [ubiquinone] 1 alpha subcomplex assembly factor 7
VSEEVAARIREAILDGGPITFATFMEHALYGPGGFYETPPVGTRGHFVTSPHVHPVFARSVGVGLELIHGSLGRPVPFRIVEVGAGDGAMARELLDGFGRAEVPVDYRAIEASPGARAALAQLEIPAFERLGEAGHIDGGVVLANELLDNLPFRRVRGTIGGPAEVRVGLDGDRSVEVLTPCPPELVEPAGRIEVGEERVVPVGALGFVDELAAALTRGYALLIDYGAEGGSAGPVHGYRDHRALENVLEDPGSSDITAGVDLGAVARRARDRGLVAFEPVRQRAALSALGYEDWSRAELERQAQALAAGRGHEAVRAWGGRSRASLLVDPAGLGGLLWLVLATPGLPEPDWLPVARGAEREGTPPSP